MRKTIKRKDLISVRTLILISIWMRKYHNEKIIKKGKCRINNNSNINAKNKT